MIAQGAQVAFRVREQALLHQFLDGAALDFQAGLAQFQQAVQVRQQGWLVAAPQVAKARAVDRHHAQGARLLGGTEQAIAPLEQFAQVQLQSAAHGADHVRLEFRIDEVLEVGQAVAGRHLEQALRIFAVPVEIGRDVVGGDGEGEHAALGVARHHDLDVGAVDHVHLHLQVAIAEAHFLARDDGHLLAQVVRADPVEGEVGERRLRAPARRHVEVEDQLLHVLAHVFVAQAVLADVGRHVGVEGAERLRAGPLVLQGAEEVDDLADGARHVLRRPGLDLARHAIQAFVQQGAQRPAGAVAGQHVEVVDVQGRFAVRRAHVGRIHLLQPVVGDDLARHIEYQAAQRVTLVGVGVDTPVAPLQVFIDGCGDIDLAARGGNCIRRHETSNKHNIRCFHAG